MFVRYQACGVGDSPAVNRHLALEAFPFAPIFSIAGLSTPPDQGEQPLERPPASMTGARISACPSSRAASRKAGADAVDSRLKTGMLKLLIFCLGKIGNRLGEFGLRARQGRFTGTSVGLGNRKEGVS